MNQSSDSVTAMFPSQTRTPKDVSWPCKARVRCDISLIIIGNTEPLMTQCAFFHAEDTRQELMASVDIAKLLCYVSQSI